MRKNIGRMVSLAVLAVLLVAGSQVPAGALEIRSDDPNVFGPGEGLHVPTAISPGDNGPWVKRLQIYLAEAGFRPGLPDGQFDEVTLGAVYAFQKVHDLDRSGVFQKQHWDLFDNSVDLPELGDAPDRVEVDLAKQVLFLVKNDRVEAVVPISSGNGESYRGSTGAQVRARTPEGDYEFYKRVDGWRISYLGGLYRPYYFRGGYAIHGSRSVPPYPASHGCVRVELHDMDYLVTELELGMPVFVYGLRISRSDVVPPQEPPPLDSRPAQQRSQHLPIKAFGSPTIF